jgi:hypothetical protein
MYTKKWIKMSFNIGMCKAGIAYSLLNKISGYMCEHPGG